MTELTVTRQDLEDAALAFDKGIYYSDLMDTFHTRVNGDEWWPAEDPGDAFELAFKLDIVVQPKEGKCWYWDVPLGDHQSKDFIPNNLTEVCKAIVLAAAEIWRAKG